ncbi:MAG: histidinol phosphate phosphatase domain-containing protein [Deltaproteobacteria bacterium]|nr:histidinol phosphate phosphatase domain-containing protein [Deltaproteobacteria bacterium]
MIDLHTHTLLSDGELLPSELVRRAVVLGYKAIAITDHVDLSNVDLVVPRTVKVCTELTRPGSITAIPGAELTHVPPGDISRMVKLVRRLGAKIVLVHGETPVEPVAPGTNMAAIEAGVDILAHPGFITEEEVKLAVKRSTILEITSRKGHSLTNGHVARIASRFGARLVVNTDTHSPGDMIDEGMARKVAMGAGLTEREWKGLIENAKNLLGNL